MKTEELLKAAKELIRALNENRCYSEAFADLAGAIQEAESAPPERKIVGISAHGYTACVDSDGCAWKLVLGPGTSFSAPMIWERLPPLPQG